MQTGLGRTGRLWGVECYGVEPDILVTGKGLSGGIYPIAAAVLARARRRGSTRDGWGHVSTFGGAELGCRVARNGARDHARPEVLANVASVSDRLGAGLEAIQRRHADWLVEIRRRGVVMGLRFAHPQGAMLMSRALYESGMWAMFAGHDPSVLQFKAGLLADAALCDETLARFSPASNAASRRFGDGRRVVALSVDESFGRSGFPADHHPPRGAVAQLGERLNGIQEVEGSTPFGSTSFPARQPAFLRNSATFSASSTFMSDW